MQARERRIIRLLIADDHEVVRVGLRLLLKRSPDIEVVGEAATAAAAIANAVRLKPDVVLLDIRLPDASGVDVCREIRAASPASRVVFLTAFADEDAVVAAVFAGADGYLLKEIASDALLSAIENVAQGRSILDPSVTRTVLRRMRSMSESGTKIAKSHLSLQEQRVLALVAEGKTNKEIAVLLRLSHKTVKNYLSSVFQKIGVARRSEAAAFFARGTKQ